MATLRRAADAARRVGALTTAARLLERALAEPPAPELVDAVDFERGRAMLDAGDEDGGRLLARVAQGAADASVRVDAARRLAKGLALRGRGTDAVAVLRAVLETLSPTATASCGWSCWSSWRSSAAPTSPASRRRCG